MDIDKSHPLNEMAPSDFYIDDGEIDKKLEELFQQSGSRSWDRFE